MFLIRVDLARICFVFEVTEETALMWLERAVKQADAVNVQLMRDLSVTEIQLDEMWNFIKRKCAENSTPEGESPETGEDGRQWIWISFAAEFRLILAAFVGLGTSESALSLIEKTAEVVKGAPCFFSDGFSTYLPALIAAHRQIFCKDRELMRKRVTFFQVFYNFSRPHQRLRVPLPENQRISQGAIHTEWLPRTPGTADGITNHVWSFRELLTIKFETIHNQSTSG